MDSILAGRPSVDTYSRASYLAAVANRVDSYWVPDHINGQTPRPLWDPKYTASARLLQFTRRSDGGVDLLGSLAARRRFNRVRLGVGVTDTGKRHPAVTAQAAATLHLMTAGGPFSVSVRASASATNPTASTGRNRSPDSRRPLATIRALWDSKGELVNRDSPFYPAARRDLRSTAVQGQVARDLDRRARPRMLRATGRYGDAWFPGFATGQRITPSGWRSSGRGSERAATR